MRPALAILAILSIAAAARGQDIIAYYSDASGWVQCGPGGCYPPGYYCPPHAYPPPPRNNPQQTPPVGSPDTPRFEPRPPLEPVKPVPPSAEAEPQPFEKPQPEIDWEAWEQKQNEAIESERKRDERSLLLLNEIKIAIQSQPGCQCQPTDLSGLDKKLDVLAELIKQNKPEPAPPVQPESTEQHVVIVADQNAPYWQRLSENIAKTKQTYHGLQTTGLPKFPIGIHPQAVVYKDSVPVRIVKGQYEVEALLSRLSRGEAI